MDFQVIANNFAFLMLQGFLGFGAFAGGTLRLAIPAIVLGFILGTAIGLARLARARWLYLAAAAYVEFFRGVPLVMVIFWFWFIVPALMGKSLPEYSVALTAFVMFEAAYLAEIVRSGIQSVPRGQVEAATATGLAHEADDAACDLASSPAQYDSRSSHPIHRACSKTHHSHRSSVTSISPKPRRL